MAKRGMLMEGEFRYLTKSSEGQFGGAYLNDEDDDRKLQTDYEKRWMSTGSTRAAWMIA
jgi:LPS-assembly protein